MFLSTDLSVMPINAASSGIVIRPFSRQASRIFPDVFPTFSRRLFGFSRRFLRRIDGQIQFADRFPVNRCDEQAAIMVIDELDVGPFVQRPFDAGPQSVVWQ